MSKQLNINLGFTADTSQARAQIASLQLELTKLTQQPVSLLGGGTQQEINQAIRGVAELQQHLKAATNVNTGALDFAKLSDSVNKSGTSLASYGEKLRSLGPAGQQAFNQLANAVAQSEIPIRRSNAMLTQFATTLKNTARWQLSSSMLHGFIGGIKSAVGYAKDLNQSLNSIRVVTGYSVDKMAEFADQANKAAKALSTTTTDYTKASLIFFQQGLSDSEVKQRTDVTIKMANVTRQSTEEVSDQMTAVWNNFADGTQTLESFADKMVALGAKTASSSDEIAGGLEKFAAIGQTVGLSFDYAAAALATITAKTRQSEEVVGTALKTIFARIQGLKLGETLEDGTDLNKYSAALKSVEIDIKDAQGNLKDMDTILEEMGAKWQTLSKDQQVALAQAVGGVRQYNQVVSLMDNWDFMKDNLDTAKNSAGALEKQSKIYQESWEAASKRVKAALEGIYQTLLDDKAFIGILNSFEKIITFVDTLIDSLGGLRGTLTTIGAIATKVFSQQIAQSLTNMATNIKLMTKDGQAAYQKEKVNTINSFISQIGGAEYTSKEDQMRQQYLKGNLLLQQEFIENESKMNALEKEVNKTLLDRNRVLGENAVQAAKNVDIATERQSDSKFKIQTELAGAAQSSTDFRWNNNLFQETAKGLNGIIEQQEAVKNSMKILGDESLKTSEKIQKITDELKESGMSAKEIDKIEKELEETAGDAEILAQKLAKLQQRETKKKAEIVFGHGDEDTMRAYREMSNTNTEDTGTGATKKSTEEYTNAIRENVVAKRQSKEASDNLKASEKGASDAIKNAQGAQQNWANTLVNCANGVMSIFSAINMLNGAIKTLQDPNTSAWEKFVSVGMSLSMMFTMLMSSYKNILLLIKSDTIATGMNTVAKLLNWLASKKSAKASKEEAMAQEADTKSNNKNTASELANAAAKKANNGVTKNVGKDGKTRYFQNGKRISNAKGEELFNQSAGKKIGSQLKGWGKNVGSAAKNLGKSFGNLAKSYGGVAAGVAIAAASVVGAIKIYNKAQDAAKKATDEATKANEIYASAQEAYQEFKGSIDDYKSAQEGLKGLQQGTIEYEEALMKANDAARELIKSNDLIQGQDYEINEITGQITITEGALYKIQKERLDNLKTAQNFALRKEQEAKEAQLEADKVDLMRKNMKAGGGFSDADGAWMLGGIGGGLGTGLAVGSLIGGVAGPIGAAVGAAVGVAVAGIGSALTNDAEDEERKAIDKIKEMYASDGEGVFANFEKTIKTVAGADEKLADALRENENAIRDLVRTETELEATNRKLIKDEAKNSNPTLTDNQVSAMASPFIQKEIDKYVEKEMDNITDIDAEYLKGVYGGDADNYKIEKDKIYKKEEGNKWVETGETVDKDSREEYVEEMVRKKAYSDDSILLEANRKVSEAESFFKDELGITEDLTNTQLFADYIETGTFNPAFLNVDTSKVNNGGKGFTLDPNASDFDEKFEEGFWEDFKNTEQYQTYLRAAHGNRYELFAGKNDPTWNELTRKEQNDYMEEHKDDVTSSDVLGQMTLDSDSGYEDELAAAKKQYKLQYDIAQTDFNNPVELFEELFGSSLKFQVSTDDKVAMMDYYKNLSTEDKEDFAKIDVAKLKDPGDSKEWEAAMDEVNLEKQAAAIGMNTDEFDLYTKSLQKNNKTLSENNKLAREMVKYSIQQEQQAKKLADKYNDLKDKLDPATTSAEEYTDACGQMATALNEVFGENAFDATFVAENTELIKSAMNGSVESVEKLQDLAGEQNLINLGIDVDEGAGKTINDWIGSQEFDDLEVGAELKNEKVLDGFNDLLEKGKITASELTNVLSEAGYAPEYEYETLTLDEAKEQGYTSTQTVEYVDPDSGQIVTADLKTLQDQKFDGGMQIKIPKLKSAKKVTDASDIASSLKKNNKNKNSGGGGSKPKKTSEAKKKKSDIVGRYKEINDELAETKRLMDKNSSLADTLWGPDKIKKIKENVKALELENQQLEKKKQLQQNYLNEDRLALEEAATKAGIKFDIDETRGGIITNYTDEMTKLFDKREALLKSFGDEIDEKEQEKLDNLDKEIEAVTSAYETYEGTLNEGFEIDQEKLDNEIKQMEDRFEAIELKLEVEVELNENDIADIEHVLERIGDNNVYESAERIAIIQKNAVSYRNIADSQIEAIREAERLFAAGQITQTDYLTRLQEGKDALQEAEMSIREGIQQISEELSNTFDLVDEKLDQQFTKFDQMIELMDHYKNVVSLTEGEASYEEFNKILKASQEVLRNRIAADESEVAMWTARREQLEAEMAGMDKNSPEYLAAEQALNNIMEKEAEAKSQLMADIEQLGEYAQEIFQNAIEQAKIDFEEAMFGGRLSSVIESIDMLNAKQEEVLTTTNKIYETNKMLRNIEKDIEATTNNRAKQAYAEFQNKVKQKQEQNELTKFELDLLTAEYEITKAQIALEEAQNAKDTVRLTRDSEGNYGYVYTANEDKVNDAEQALEDATNNYYNTALEGAQKYQDQIYQHIEEWEAKVTEVMMDQTLSEEEKNKKIAEINATYDEMIRRDKELYYIAIDGMRETSYTKQVDYDLKGIKSAEKWFTESEGFISNLQIAQDEYDIATEEVKKHTEDNFGKMSTAIKNTKEDAEKLKNELVDELVPKLNNEIKDAIDEATEAWWRQVAALKEVIRLTDEAMKKNHDTQLKETYKDDYAAEISKRLANGASYSDYDIQQLLQYRWEKMGGVDNTDYAALIAAGGTPEQIALWEVLRRFKIEQTDWSASDASYAGDMRTEKLDQDYSELIIDYFTSSPYGRWSDSQVQKYLNERETKIKEQNLQGKVMSNAELKEYVAQKLGKKPEELKTGGYTGAWGSEGRLAVLHEKELVLNKQDTENFLSATNILREISQMLDRDAFIASLGAINLRAMTLNSPADQVLQQEVTIHADFPNVTDHNEIEIAIDNLINAASQHAYKT